MYKVLLSYIPPFFGGQGASAHSAGDAGPSAAAQTHGSPGAAGPLQEQYFGVPADSHPPESGSIDSLPPAVQRVAQEVQLQPAALPAQTTSQVAQQPSVSDLTPLCIAKPGSLARNVVVIDALEVHAHVAGTVIARDDIVGYVALGERAVREIRKLGAVAASAQAPKEWPHVMGVALTPSLEVIRAISWYVVACAAKQDAKQYAATGQPRIIDGKQVTDLSIAGSYMFDDPGRAIYHFMNSSPVTYARISTHFNERSAGEITFGQADQRGIEDYDRRLPGENGTVLFDKLKDVNGQQVMFVKFEHAGVPPLGSAWRVDDQGQGGATVYTAAERVLSHALSFIWTRFAAVPGVERKEHVYKGLLKNNVYLPFMDLVKAAHMHGLLEEAMNGALHAKESQNQGLPHLVNTLIQLREKINAQPKEAPGLAQLSQDLDKLQKTIENVKNVLDAQSSELNITRRGAETHVVMPPSEAHLERAHQSFKTFGGDAANPPGPLEPYELEVSAVKHKIPAGVYADTAREWAAHGIEINGVAYPVSNASNWVAPGLEGRMSTLEQACKAFVAACGSNSEAAYWISRFARQALAEPLLQYLRTELLETMGQDMDLSNGRRNLSIESREEGDVKLTLNFQYINRKDVPMENTNALAVVTLAKEAELHASVSLRFKQPSASNFQQAGQPEITVTYETSNFDISPIDEDFNAVLVERW